MDDAKPQNGAPADKATLDEDISVAPPDPHKDTPPMPKVRTAHDASDDEKLARDPSDPDAQLDIGLDETFPSSDPPSNTQPGSSEPAPSSGYDEEAEKGRQRSS
ncbi:MAG TPA: hypothetical protein VFL92_08620 [Sphingomonas sp.]|nr:hypothetical protein [Sphingomonas sp.]